MRNSLNSILILRLGGILLVVLMSLFASGIWLKKTVIEQATATQLENARKHYAAILSDLDRRWGREAFNLKSRIEAQNIIDVSRDNNEKLLTYLISQGSGIEFPSLRIEKVNGELIAAYDYSRHGDIKLKVPHGQFYSWVRSPSDGTLYLAIRQFIWMGNENGYLILFKPMDHAMLAQISYPGTSLSLWWQGEALASSDGDDGVMKSAAAFAKPESGKNTVALSWAGPETELTPKLLVELHESAIFDTGKLSQLVALVFMLILLATTVAIYPLWQGISRQFDALLHANERFSKLGEVDEKVTEALQAVHLGPLEEVRQLASALEEHMQNTRINADHRAPPPSASNQDG